MPDDPDEPKFLKNPPPGPDPRAPRPRPASVPPRPMEALPVTMPADWMFLRSRAGDMSLAVPQTWRGRTEDEGGLSFEARDGQGRRGEIFLHQFGFEKQVPELEVYLGTQRTMLLEHNARTVEDRALTHPSGLPCHLLAWSSIEPTGERWMFRAAYLRTGGAIYVWKLDQAGDGSPQLAKEHLETFKTLRPK